MKITIKRQLLRYGGYSAARHFYLRLERQKLARVVKQFWASGKMPLPKSVIFEPTLRCNLRCRMCYQDRGNWANLQELTQEQIISFFEHTPHLRKVSLIGGEIFVRRDILPIIYHLDRSHDIVLSTNGTLLDNDYCEALQRCRRIFTICISLDGPLEIHDSIRRVSGSWDKTVKAIRSLQRFFPLTVNCVIQTENLTQLPKVVEQCAKLGVKKLKLEFERIHTENAITQVKEKTGLGSHQLPSVAKEHERAYSVSSLKSVLKECLNRSKKHRLYIVFDPYFLLSQLQACHTGNLRHTQKFLCRNFQTATITPDGNLIHCRKLRKPYGNIRDGAFAKIWNSNEAQNFRRLLMKSNLTPLCENCPSLVPC